MNLSFLLWSALGSLSYLTAALMALLLLVLSIVVAIPTFLYWTVAAIGWLFGGWLEAWGMNPSRRS